MDLNRYMGTDYELGLSNLKTLCEGIAHKKYRGYEIASSMMAEKTYVGIRKVQRFQDMTVFYEQNLPKAMDQVTKSGATIAGPPSGLYWTFDEKTMITDMAAAIPVAEAI